MKVVSLILFLAVSALWFFSNEYPALFGLYVPASVVRRRTFKMIVAVFLILSLYFSVYAGVPGAVETLFSTCIEDFRSIFIILISALVTLMAMRLFSLNGAAVFAILGALQACRLNAGAGIQMHLALSVLASLAAAFALSALLRFIFRHTLEKSNLHLITLSYYMRFAVLAGLVLTSCAVGLNWGGFLMAGISLSGAPQYALWVIIIVLAAAIFALSPFLRLGTDASASRYSDFSIYTVITVGFSVALTLIVFSFDRPLGIASLIPMPLSVSSLVAASIAGAGIVCRNSLISREEYMKEGLALLIAPSGSFLIAAVIFRLTGGGEVIVDFTVLAAALLIVTCLFFSAYMLRQKRQREATERLVYSQQQQIYENSRALNDMELKVVLSENQALHNAVEMKRQEVMNVALSIVEQKEYLESLYSIVRRLARENDAAERDNLIGELSASLKQRLSYDRDVDSQYFYAQAESLHEDFSAKLSENFPDLTQQEKRLATLLRLGFSSKYIATLMNITPKSVEISRYRLRQKLGLSRGDNLVNYIKSI